MLKTLKESDFSLVLSGGGALGIAHLGTIKDLEAKGIVPSEIVGTSMGGIIGACVAFGLNSKDILEILSRFSSVTKWIKFSLSGNSIIDSSKVEEIFISIFGNKRIADCKIPLKLIATKLSNGQKRVFSLKDDILIKDALLATMAIPGIFSEKKIGDSVYVDGFLCENLGLKEASLETILAIDVLGFNSFEKDIPDNFLKTVNVLEMFEKSMRLLIYNQTKLIREQLSSKRVFLIEPKTYEYKTYQFHKFEELIKIGEGLL